MDIRFVNREIAPVPGRSASATNAALREAPAKSARDRERPQIAGREALTRARTATHPQKSTSCPSPHILNPRSVGINCS